WLSRSRRTSRSSKATPAGGRRRQCTAAGPVAEGAGGGCMGVSRRVRKTPVPSNKHRSRCRWGQKNRGLGGEGRGGKIYLQWLGHSQKRRDGTGGEEIPSTGVLHEPVRVYTGFRFGPGGGPGLPGRPLRDWRRRRREGDQGSAEGPPRPGQ